MPPTRGARLDAAARPVSWWWAFGLGLMSGALVAALASSWSGRSPGPRVRSRVTC